MLLALVVSRRLKMLALDAAPTEMMVNSQFFLHTTKGDIVICVPGRAPTEKSFLHIRQGKVLAGRKKRNGEERSVKQISDFSRNRIG